MNTEGISWTKEVQKKFKEKFGTQSLKDVFAWDDEWEVSMINERLMRLRLEIFKYGAFTGEHERVARFSLMEDALKSKRL